MPVANASVWNRWNFRLVGFSASLLLLVSLELFAIGVVSGIGTHLASWWISALKNALPEGGLGARRLSIAFLLGVLIFGEGSWDDRESASSSFRFSPFFLCLHLAAFSLSLFLIVGLARHSPSFARYRAAALLLCVPSYLLTVTLACATFCSPSVWVPRLRPLGRSVLAGVGCAALVYVSGSATRYTWKWFYRATYTGVKFLLAPIVPGIDFHRFQIVSPRFRIAVRPECSGYEGIGMILVVVILYLRVFREELKFPRALLLVPIGVGLVWLCNLFRIASLFMVGELISARVAWEGFHVQAGWIAFCSVALLVVAMAQRLSFFAKEVTTGSDEIASAHLTPLLVFLATAMCTGAFTADDFDWFYPLRVVGLFAVVWHYRATLGQILATRPSFVPWVIGAVVFAGWAWVRPPSSAATSIPQTLAALPRHAATTWLAFRAVGYIVAAPLCEELFFRGYLQRRFAEWEWLPLDATWRPIFAVALSSILFGAFHGDWLAGSIAGAAYGFAQLRRGRTGDALIAHAVTNGLLAISVWCTGEWGYWS